MPAHQINCPVCQKPMTKFKAPSGIEIDSCDAHGVWLDSNELDALLQQERQAQPQEPGAFAGAGRTFVQSAVGGAGFSFANMVIRKLFG